MDKSPTILDGKAIAHKILDELKQSIATLQRPPLLVVILVGDNEASLAYIRQKQKAAVTIEAHVIVFQFPAIISQPDLLKAITDIEQSRVGEWEMYITIGAAFKNEPASAIIVQRPLPKHIDYQSVLATINPELDIDGFHPDSPFNPPVAMAVLRMMAESLDTTIEGVGDATGHMRVVLIGYGDTAGKPISKTLEKFSIPHQIVTRETDKAHEITKNADIIIVAVGIPNLITKEWVKPGAIIIDVGISRLNGKLTGDVDKSATEIAKIYTPVPGGVGPVNVAYLMKNLVSATRIDD